MSYAASAKHRLYNFKIALQALQFGASQGTSYRLAMNIDEIAREIAGTLEFGNNIMYDPTTDGGKSHCSAWKLQEDCSCCFGMGRLPFDHHLESSAANARPFDRFKSFFYTMDSSYEYNRPSCCRE